MHEGGHFWLNAVEMSSDFLAAYSTETVPASRAQHFLYWGMGLSKLLSGGSIGATLTQQYAQLMEEFEYLVGKTLWGDDLEGGIGFYATFAQTLTNTCSPYQHSHANIHVCMHIPGGGGMQGMKVLMAKSLHHPYPTLEAIGNAQMKKFNGDIVYEVLPTPHVSIPLDYAKVVSVLCSLFSDLYGALLHPDNYRYTSAPST